MEKYASDKHAALRGNQPFSYFSTNLYLDWCAHVFDRNGEPLIVWQDALYRNEFPCIFMPKKRENWVRCSIAFATQEDVENMRKEGIEILAHKPIESEFFYNTDDFINPKGNLKNRINKFSTSYTYSLSRTAEKKKILEFYRFWKSQREHEGITLQESEDFFIFCLENLDRYDIQQVYVEADEKIVGLAWGIDDPDSKGWIGLHLKVDYLYTGLSRFLHHERAKLFSLRDKFSLGTGAHDKGINQFKEDLGPASKKEYFYVLTGEKR